MSTPRRQRPAALVLVPLVALAMVVLSLATTGSSAVAVNSPGHDRVVGDVPPTTPSVLDGQVRALAEVGAQIVVGGSFTQASSRDSGSVLSRPYVLAFDAATGSVSSGFTPSVNGAVETVLPGPSAGTVYIGGSFTQVNGTTARHVALLDLGDGSLVNGFSAPANNGAVNVLERIGGRLYVGGNFSTMGGAAHAGFASLDATTGRLDPYVSLQVSGHHNDTGSGAQGAVGVRDLDVTPDGSRLVAIGNFKRVDGLLRDQLVVVDLDAGGATVAPDWSTDRFSPYCFSWAFDTYVRGVDVSPDGSYFVVSSTGGQNAGTLCDTAARFEFSSTGTTIQPTWVDYTGGDTLWSVEVTESAVYVGGHQRWMNNSHASDQAGPGAVPRPGIAALDTETGMPLGWNPGRNPRGAAAFALLATETGLWVGSDTEWIGNFAYHRPRLAFFPLADGTPVVDPPVEDLPATVYLAGSTGVTDHRYLYRVNAGGPQLGSADGGPAWAADTDATSPFRSSGSNAAGWSPVPDVDASVPVSAPRALFESERWDPAGGDEMAWHFPVDGGTPLQVRLYLANRCTCTASPGQRQFDVTLDGSTVLDDYDIVADVGDQRGTMKSFDIVSDGQVDIELSHVVENPLVDGIEIVRTDLPAPPAGASDGLQTVALDDTGAGTAADADAAGIAWGRTRGAFLLDGTLYYGWTDGFLHKRTFDGDTFGADRTVDPYHDPAWAGVNTGSGNTYDGSVSSYYSELPSVTGMFYAQGRLYYTLQGQSQLFYRGFSPDSEIVGADRFVAPSGRDWSDTAGLFLAGDDVYVVSAADGSLSRVTFANGAPSGPATLVDGPGGNDWRARATFMTPAEPVVPNEAPTASFTRTCSGLTCTFDASGSSDADGRVTDYAWSFGDGADDAGVSVTHTFAQAGAYPVTLDVTDDGGASDRASASVTVSPPADAAVAFVGADSAAGARRTVSVTVPPQTQAGDGIVLFLSRGGPADELTAPTGVGGWTQEGNQASGSMATRVWSKPAAAGDAGREVTFDFAQFRKVNVSVVVYSGTDAADPVSAVASAADAGGLTHRTPTLDGQAGTWVVSYWADKSSSTTAWTAPGGQVVRSESYDDGGGRITSLLTDGGALSSSATVGGLTASVDQPSSRATTWTVALAPAGDGGGDPAPDPGPGPGTGSVDPVGVTSFAGARMQASLPVPQGTRAGDLLVLFVSRGGDDEPVTEPQGAGAWDLLATQPTRSLVTRLWSRVATQADVGGRVELDFAEFRKLNMTLAAYSGADAVDPASDVWHTSDASTAQHTTPTGTTSTPTWVVSYWADKSSSTTAWSPPPGQTLRQETYDSGGGRITSLLTDDAALASAGQVGGRTATTDAPSSLATTWTLALSPATGG